jgi:hypothetical protein
MLLKCAGGLGGLGGSEGYFNYLIPFTVTVLSFFPWISCKEFQRRHPKEANMKTYSRLLAPDLTRQLVAAGILRGDAEDAANTHPTPPGLLVSQVGGFVESTAFDLDCGCGTGYILSLHVAVDLPAFGILGWRLDLPWEDPQFQWLTDPTEYMSSDNMYQVPGCSGLKYPRDEVINHRRLLRRGHGFKGLLLGYGFESIPDSYHHGATIDASLVLIDEMGRGFSTAVQLWADRSARINRKRAQLKTSRRLLENCDYVNVS